MSSNAIIDEIVREAMGSPNELIIRAICEVARKLGDVEESIDELTHATRGVEASLDHNVTSALEGMRR